VSLKRIAAWLPRPVAEPLARLRMKLRARRLSRLPIEQAFDEIYRKRMWQQGESLSGVGSEGQWADAYVEWMRGFIAEHDVRTVADLGCGDFLVGSRIAPLVGEYRALDISPTVIGLNRKAYAHLKNVRFEVANLIETAIPDADLILVRQVFQHLSNAQIEAALANIERARFRWLVVSEDIAAPGRMEQPNADLASHSMDTRVSRNSGIVLSEPPFSRHATIAGTIHGDGGSGGSVLAIQVIERRAAA
jgi:SAM-dependent methyltransferase